MLGMYVHTHWAYHHPYAARTWSFDDWDHYLRGLRALGYDAITLWPQLDCMPAEPTASDMAYLNTVARVIDLAHDTYGMQFAVLACPNTIGNEQAPAYAYAERPYFVCERKVNPRDRTAVEALLAGRRKQLYPLRRADAFVVIDSDPGGYIGSTNEEFVSLTRAQLDILREFNPNIALDYWMWMGWETYNRFWAAVSQSRAGDPEPHVEWDVDVFVDTLTLLREQIAEPWGVLACVPAHVQATDRLGMADKRRFFPYGLIEGEPTFPLTNYDPPAIAARLSAYSSQAFPRGSMANAQTHCMQLPGIYLFSHFAQGGALDTLDLEGFAERVLPGHGRVVAQAWQVVESPDPRAKRSAAAALRRRLGTDHAEGECSGLLFGDPDRFLTDLAGGLEIRAALDDLKSAIDARVDVKAALRDVLGHVRPYQSRTGFADAYYGPLRDGLNTQVARLGDPRINAVAQQFSDWRNPAIRNGILPRLLDALDAYCAAVS